jgi:Protein of unknown function (DUF3175)
MSIFLRNLLCLPRKLTKMNQLKHSSVFESSIYFVLQNRHNKKMDSNQKNWSQDVTKHSDALDLEEGVFTWVDPAKIAQSLKSSAEKSNRRKGTPYQSAMSMLNFYLNRAGHNLPLARRKVLEAAKDELRLLFNRPR